MGFLLLQGAWYEIQDRAFAMRVYMWVTQTNHSDKEETPNYRHSFHFPKQRLPHVICKYPSVFFVHPHTAVLLIMDNRPVYYPLALSKIDTLNKENTVYCGDTNNIHPLQCGESTQMQHLLLDLDGDHLLTI